jgi:hypothetical protein
VSALQQAPESLSCPQCPVIIALDPDSPDDDLEAFWAHLGVHTLDRLRRLRLWTAARNSEVVHPDVTGADPGAFYGEAG